MPACGGRGDFQRRVAFLGNTDQGHGPAEQREIGDDGQAFVEHEFRAHASGLQQLRRCVCPCAASLFVVAADYVHGATRHETAGDQRLDALEQPDQ